MKPTENLATGQLPGLDEDGITATYHRQTALSRDEVTFLTWEHPIISETMAALLGSDIGKASLGTFKHRGVPAGTILLESLYRVECRAPAYLETGQFLDQRPLRMLLPRAERESVTNCRPSFLADALQSVPSATSATALHKLRPVIETLLPSLENRAESEIKAARDRTRYGSAILFARNGATHVFAERQSIHQRRGALRTASSRRDCQRALANTKPFSKACESVSRSSSQKAVPDRRRVGTLLNRIGPAGVDTSSPEPACREVSASRSESAARVRSKRQIARGQIQDPAKRH